MIIKNEIPILEFDSDNTAVIMPTHFVISKNGMCEIGAKTQLNVR